MKKRILSIFLCLVLLLCFLPVTARAVTTVDKISVTLAYPEAGKNPPATATCNGNGYSIYAIDWFDRETNAFLESGEKIQADHAYEVTVWVEAKQVKQAKKDGLVDQFIYGSISASYLADIVDSL